MLNNLNNKAKHDGSNILIKLAKKGDGFMYLNDSLNESTKIKIPIDDSLKKEKRQNERKAIIQTGLCSLPKEAQSDKEDEENLEISALQKQVEESLKQNIVVPSCSQWFKIEDVHELEINSLPEFFCGKYPSKTPLIYKEYRNFIINLYRENPSSYLSSTCI
jgi:hypothetical protein